MAWLKEFKLALLSLKKVPGFVLTTTGTLALTLGALLLAVSISAAFLFKPLEFPKADQLVLLQTYIEVDNTSDSRFQSVKSHIKWYKEQTVFDKMALVHTGYNLISSLRGEPRLNISYVTPDYFNMFAVPLALGRGLSLQETIDRQAKVILISERVWRNYFNSAPNVIEQSVTVGAQQYQIVGVIAERYNEPHLFGGVNSDLWLPFDAGPQMGVSWSHTFAQLKSVGRLKNGTSIKQAETQLETIIESVRDQWSAKGEEFEEMNPDISSFRDAMVDNNDKLSVMLLAGAISLLLVAVVNVTNLFFSRAVAKQKTLAIKATLGARQKNLFLTLFAEVSLICLAALLAGLALAALGLKGFVALAEGHMPLVHAITLDMSVFATAIIVTGLLSIFFAFSTLRMINYRALKDYIQSSGKGTANQVSSRKVKLLIMIQVTLASALLLFSTLILTKALEHKIRPLGADIEDVYNLHVISKNDALKIEDKISLLAQIKSRLKTLDGVADIAIGTGPISTRYYAFSLANMDNQSFGYFRSSWAGEHYFDLLDIKILKGRRFSNEAYRGQANEILVTESTAKQLDPNGNVLGKTYLGLEDKPYEVIGVTEDIFDAKIRYYNEGKGARVFWPNIPNEFNIKVKMHQDKPFSRDTAYKMLKQINDSLMIWEYNDFEALHAESVYQQTLTVYLSASLALFTLLLASIGIYGVLSYNTNLRRFEFGIRMALGARRKQLYRLMNKESLQPVLIATAISIVIVTTTVAVFYDKLNQWISINIGYLLLGLLLSLAIATTACFLPMRNVIRQNPVEALRDN